MSCCSCPFSDCIDNPSMVQHSALGAALGRDRMFFDLEQAVAKHRESSGETLLAEFTA